MAKKGKKSTEEFKNKDENKEILNEQPDLENNNEKSDKEDKNAEVVNEEVHENDGKDEKKSESQNENDNKLKEFQDKYLRLSAEFDNYRKRTLKEKADLTKSATAEVLINLLPVVDDFERGMETVSNAKSIEAIQEGMKLIHNKFKEFMKQNGVKEIEAKDQDFDTDMHEAVTKIPAPKEDLKGKVVDVIQKGYKLNDKIIRYAKVVIGE